MADLKSISSIGPEPPTVKAARTAMAEAHRSLYAAAGDLDSKSVPAARRNIERALEQLGRALATLPKGEVTWGPTRK